MTPNGIVHHSKHHALLAGVSAVVLGLAVIVIGYGIVQPPQAVLSFSGDTSAAARSDKSSERLAMAIPTNASPMMYQPPASAAAERGGAVDADRECSIEEGVTDACIFS